MARRITMPSLGQSMEEGTIVRWLKAEGDTVVEGEPLFEVMTDKVTIEAEAPASGTLLKIIAQVDAIVPIGDEVAVIGEANESIEEAAATSNKPVEVQSAATESAVSLGTNTTVLEQPKSKTRVHASPLARRHADENGIDIALIGVGSGPEGRIVKSDVISYCASLKTQPVITTVQVSPETAPKNGKVTIPDALGDYTVVPLAGMRKMVADALTRSAANPHVTITLPVDMTEAAKLRNQLLPVIEKSHGVRVSYTDIIAWATARALLEHPIVNSTLIDNQIRMHNKVHLGIAVSLGTDGLIVPVIRNAQTKSIGAISVELKDLAGRARAGKLGTDEVSGGTFSITNLGSYGVTTFNPIINTPQAAILGVCGIVDTIVPVNGVPEVRPMMNLCLSFDHRITDGAPASAFLARLKEILQAPYLLFA